jgi:hypothetical protein
MTSAMSSPRHMDLSLISPRAGGGTAVSSVDQITSEKRQAYLEKQQRDERIYGALLRQKTPMRKCGRDKKRKDVILTCSTDLKQIQWGTNSMDSNSITAVESGRNTPIFQSYDAKRSDGRAAIDADDARSFSIIFPKRSLDLGNNRS